MGLVRLISFLSLKSVCATISFFSLEFETEELFSIWGLEIEGDCRFVDSGFGIGLDWLIWLLLLWKPMEGKLSHLYNCFLLQF